jgi:hypothetical protein
MRKQHRWTRQQLIWCFIHTYTQAHRFSPTVREIGAWVGCPGLRSRQLALETWNGSSISRGNLMLNAALSSLLRA